MQNEFNVSLPQYEDGRLNTYFATVSACLGKLNWTVSTEVKLSTFSYLKMNMYLDIKSNEKQILKNDNVKMLIGDYEAIECSDTTDENVTVDINGLIKTLASQLGFSRAGGSIQTRTRAALDYLKKLNKINLAGENITLLN